MLAGLGAQSGTREKRDLFWVLKCLRYYASTHIPANASSVPYGCRDRVHARVIHFCKISTRRPVTQRASFTEISPLENPVFSVSPGLFVFCYRNFPERTDQSACFFHALFQKRACLFHALFPRMSGMCVPFPRAVRVLFPRTFPQNAEDVRTFSTRFSKNVRAFSTHFSIICQGCACFFRALLP